MSKQVGGVDKEGWWGRLDVSNGAKFRDFQKEKGR